MKWNMDKVNLKHGQCGLMAVKFNTSPLWFTHTDWLMGKPWISDFAPDSPYASVMAVFEKIGKMVKATECEVVDLYSDEHGLLNRDSMIDYRDIVDVVANHDTRDLLLYGIGFKKTKENGSFGGIQEKIDWANKEVQK